MMNIEEHEKIEELVDRIVYVSMRLNQIAKEELERFNMEGEDVNFRLMSDRTNCLSMYIKALEKFYKKDF